jgi:hypothetical protein
MTRSCGSVAAPPIVEKSATLAKLVGLVEAITGTDAITDAVSFKGGKGDEIVADPGRRRERGPCGHSGSLVRPGAGEAEIGGWTALDELTLLRR